MVFSKAKFSTRPAQFISHLALIAAVALATLGPLAFLIVHSFSTAPLGQEISWGLDGWREAFGAPRTMAALVYSLLLSTRTFVGVILAFLVSWLLIRVRIPAAPFIEFSLWMAWFLPPLSVTIGWIALLDPQNGLINQLLAHIFPASARLNIYSFAGIFWVHLSLLTVPVMTILLAPALRQMDGSFEESARSCGSGPLQTLTRIVIPLLWPAILVVVIASLIRSLEAFEIEQIIGIPAGIYVYGTRIYDLVRWDPPLYSQAMALSTIFLLVLFVLVVLYQRFTRAHEFATLRPGGMSFRPALIGRWKYAASALLILWVLVSIYLPLAMVLIGSFMKFFGMFKIANPFTLAHWTAVLRDPAFVKGLQSSLTLGLGVATLGIVVYAFLGYMIQRRAVVGKAALSFLVWIPWAIPGILLGLSLLWIFLGQRYLSFLYGTKFLLIFAIVLKDMPIGTQMFKTAFAQISKELEEASQVVGASEVTTFRRITMPMVAPMMVSVFVLVFMSSIRDVSTPILLATPATTPLAVLMLERSVAGEIEKAAVIGVMLAALAIVTAAVTRRLGFRMGVEPT